jgi:hypothetical protein
MYFVAGMCSLQIRSLADDELKEIKGNSDFGCLFTDFPVEKVLEVSAAHVR